MKKRVILCFFGVISRSIRYTYDSIKKNIIDVLNSEPDVELSIYVFNLNIENTVIDNRIVNQKDVNIIPYNYFEEYDQKALDKNELSVLRNKIEVRFRYDYNQHQIQNALRQMYSEFRVGAFLEKTNFDLAIVCGPDFFIANKINMNDLISSYSETGVVYTSTMNDAQGYTNGFYFGRSENVVKILKRYERLDSYLPTDKDYEYILKSSFEDSGITRKITNIVFFKIRANGNVFWTKKYQGLTDSEVKKVFDIYDSLHVDRMCSVEYCGGLGNQLFQMFALLSYCIDNKKTPVLRYSEHSPSITPRQTYWQTMFKELKNFGEIREGIILKEPNTFNYLPNFDDNVILSGYFQSYKYFINNLEPIIRLLKINSQIEEIRNRFSDSYLKKENNQTIVSVHFRLGDYKHLQEQHPLLPSSYYQNSINELKNRGVENIKVIYFCEEEDKEMVEKEYLSIIEVDNVVKVGGEVSDVEQMLLMSCADWNIIANSTFSWWGAFLNKNKNVIIPKRWFHDDTPNGLVPEYWILVENN